MQNCRALKHAAVLVICSTISLRLSLKCSIKEVSCSTEALLLRCLAPRGQHCSSCQGCVLFVFSQELAAASRVLTQSHAQGEQ